MAKGIKTGGRKKGTPNKLTASTKEAIGLAFQGIGGVKALQEWALGNRGDFYTRIWVRLLPQEMEHAGKDGGPIQMTDTERQARVLSLLDAAKRRKRSA